MSRAILPDDAIHAMLALDGGLALARKRARDAELAETSFKDFVKQAWYIVEPAPMAWSWGIEAVAEHLQAVTEGHIKQLIINVPPRTLKTLMGAVFWPAWVWISKPQLRWFFLSYSADLSIEASVKCRRLIQSPWYKQNWGKRYRLTGDQNAKERYENDKLGTRLSSSVSGLGTGAGGDVLALDDPNNAKQTESDVVRESVNRWWDGTMSTRANDPKSRVRVIIQQRLHERDLTGHILSKNGGKDWVHLCLPMRFESQRKCITYVNNQEKPFFEDPRKVEGELLAPDRFGDHEVKELERDLGSYAAAGQLQQRPAPAAGGMLKRHWWNYWQPRGAKLPPVPVQMPDGKFEERRAIDLPMKFDMILQSWDFAFKGKQDSDFVAGIVAAAAGADRFMLDMERGQWDLPESLNAVRRLSMRWPNAVMKLVEDKANGPAVIASLKHEIGGFIEVQPDGGKVGRASAVSPQIEAGNWYLPHPKLAEWVGDPANSTSGGFLGECAMFPLGKNDDMVDSLSMAGRRLLHFTGPKPKPQYAAPVNSSVGERSWMR